MPFAVALEDIVEHIVALQPGIIDVEIGRTASFRIDKTLKIKVELNRIHIGDPQAVGHHRVGPASAAYMVISAGHGITDDIPGDKKIGREPQFVDDFKFVFNPSFCFCIIFSIAVQQSFHRQFFEQNPVVVAA